LLLGNWATEYLPSQDMLGALYNTGDVGLRKLTEFHTRLYFKEEILLAQ